MRKAVFLVGSSRRGIRKENSHAAFNAMSNDAGNFLRDFPLELEGEKNFCLNVDLRDMPGGKFNKDACETDVEALGRPQGSGPVIKFEL